jgi:hypothetical protein
MSNIIWGVGSNISCVNTVLIPCWLRGIETGLCMDFVSKVDGQSPNKLKGVYLNEILSFRLGDEGLKFGSCECVDQSSFGHYQKEHLSAGEDREFIGLFTSTRQF